MPNRAESLGFLRFCDSQFVVVFSASNRATASDQTPRVVPIVAQTRKVGVTALAGTAEVLNARGIKMARRDETWRAVSVNGCRVARNNDFRPPSHERDSQEIRPPRHRHCDRSHGVKVPRVLLIDLKFFQFSGMR